MRWMTGLTLGGVALLASCLQAKSQDCGNGIYCPVSLVCVDAEPFCAEPTCLTLADGDPCTSTIIEKGYCATNTCTACSTDLLVCRYEDEWVSMTSPAVGDLRAVWAAAPNDVYAVGSGGAVIHYDGIAWTRVRTLGTSTLIAIWGSAPDNFYLAASGISGDLFHYDGQWPQAREALPAFELTSVGGSGPTDVVVSGLTGEIFRYDGSWDPETSGAMGAALRGVWARSIETIAVGAAGVIQEAINRNWPATQQQPVSGISVLNSVWATDDGHAFAVGNTGAAISILERTSPTSGWVSETELPTVTPGGVVSLLAVWGTAVNNVFAVGTNGTVVHYDGTDWKTPPRGTPTTSRLFGVSGAGGEVFAVGANNTILRFSSPAP